MSTQQLRARHNSSLLIFDKEVRKLGYRFIAGVDEAGRGPLAGPVVAAACIVSEEVTIAGVNDSKKLTPKVREALFEEITSHDEILIGVGVVSSEKIDEINILQGTILAMHLALVNLKEKPDYLLVDGLALNYEDIPCQKVIKGDAKSFSIAAASIVAKETRDRLMMDYHEKWPEFNFASHKGYGTNKHVEALQKHGPCPIHRLTFEPVKSLVCKK